MPKKIPESETVRTPAVFEAAHPAIKPEALKHKRLLTLDVISISRLGEVLMQCDGELTAVEMPSKFAENGKSQAWTIDVTDIVRSERYMLVCNAVLASSLRRAGEPLTGRYFAVRVGEFKAGKRYRETEVVELERIND